MEIAYYYETRYVQETSCLTEFINVTSLTLIHGYERQNIETMDAAFFKGKASFFTYLFFHFSFIRVWSGTLPIQTRYLELSPRCGLISSHYY